MKKLIIFGGIFDEDKKKEEILSLEKETEKDGFWNDLENSTRVTKKISDLKNEVEKLENVKKKIEDDLDGILLLEEESDDELQKSIEEDIKSIEETFEEISLLLLLSSEYDKCDAIVDIHSGAGGTEACDWANMLFRMYTRYFEKQGYSYTVLDQEDGLEAGIKSVSIKVSGNYVYGYLKSEKGVHRLVRLSPFDSAKRRHTSFASVQVTPVIDQSIDLEINDKDLRIDIYRSSGKGGQGVNTTDSAVRITHIPSGIVVTCQNERSQIQNKEEAMKVLKSRLYEQELSKKEEEEGQTRRSKIGTGDRAEKIRTYNYPQNRVTDHRIGFTTKNLDRVMDGDLDQIIEALITADQTEKLKGQDNEG